MNDLINALKVKFPKEVVLEPTKNNLFENKGHLLKKENYNEYCFAQKAKDGFGFTIFKCDWKDFEKVENEFLEHSFSFLVANADEAKAVMTAFV